MAQDLIKNNFELLVIGGSAGSLEVLLNILPSVKKESNLAIVIVLHRKNIESLLPELLAEKTSWVVKEAEEKEMIVKNTIYVAPADYHLLIESDHSFSLDYSEKIHYSRPSIDSTFETAAEAYGAHLIAILLSGANADGASGLKTIKDAGGLTIAQEPSEAAVAYMPQQAINLDAAHYILSTREMIELVNSHL